MQKRPLCVLTTAFNEPDFLPVWYRYYSQQVGAENCFIIDHGSTDFSTSALKDCCPVLRIPRINHNDTNRAKLVSHFSAGLLTEYDAVIYADADELVVADPDSYSDLIDASKRARPGVGAITTFGFDLTHDFDNEPAVDFQRKILHQRSWVRPLGFLCKPSLIREPVQFFNGFHGYNGGCVFDNIYLFHLAYIDKAIIAKRQRKRNMSVTVDGGGGHHKIEPEKMIDHIRQNYLQIERFENIDISIGSEARERYLDQLFDVGKPREHQRIKDYTIVPGLWKLPHRLRDSF